MMLPSPRSRLPGAWWYQGECNSKFDGALAQHYACQLPALIASWRAAWGIGDFAFNLVQVMATHHDTP